MRQGKPYSASDDVSNYLHHDFMIGDKKVQKMFLTCTNIATKFKLSKSNGKSNGESNGEIDGENARHCMLSSFKDERAKTIVQQQQSCNFFSTPNHEIQ